ncbi:alanine racemase [Alicyclobacillus sp. SO9]|uniref:alanine racemase n=1 Tax=Alicyclobacillus sp. SO9 TaxID=2665646 RepID=UPI0018E6EAF3|nr:alanine racemase [Alicyclobacillus sp. SO9]QQE78617.1 alanine racemase [Alicyclobacillus sp. SO9]
MYRGTFAIIDENAIRENVRAVVSRLHHSVKMLVAVKADGYGHGMIQAAKAALAGGADYLGVATLEEALELRNHPLFNSASSPIRILVLGSVSHVAARVAAENEIDVTVTDNWSGYDVPPFSRPLRVHLKIDSGMSRLGFVSEEESLAAAQWLSNRSDIHLTGVFTHFACADARDLHHAQHQVERFEAHLDNFRRHGIQPELVHAANSAATLRVPEWHYDMVRLGISAYGYPPSDDFECPIDLQQALHLYTFVSRVAEIPAGETVGYGGTFKAKRPTRIATVPIGYADGYSRHLSNQGYVLVHAKKAPVVGNVCMDQLMIDTTDIDNVKPGDCVTIYGKSAPDEWEFAQIDGLTEEEQQKFLLHSFQKHRIANNAEPCVSVHKLAQSAGTISYELTCALSSRVLHLYTELDEISGS